MGQEEEIQRRGSCCSSNINIGLIRSSSSKKLQKQKKVPQRGLGVAQLEKIRLEEQQRNKLHPFNSPSPSPPKPNPNLPSFSIPIPIDSISSPNSILSLQNNIDIYNNNNNSNLNAGCHSSLNWNSSSSDQLNLEKDNCALFDQFNPIWPLHSLMQRSHCYQSSPPSMMNVPSRSSSSSSSLLNLHMELPSNQINSCTVPLWPNEDKMVGMKRSYPFAMENPIGPSFHCKLPTIIHPFERSEESISFGINGATSTLNPNFRCCDSISEAKQNCKKSKKENGDFNGDFLTLAPPPPTAFTSPISNFQPCESLDFSSLPYQGIREDEIIEAAAGTNLGNEVQPFYSFLPPAIMQIGQPTFTSTCNYGGDFGGNVIDLNLKL